MLAVHEYFGDDHEADADEVDEGEADGDGALDGAFCVAEEDKEPGDHSDVEDDEAEEGDEEEGVGEGHAEEAVGEAGCPGEEDDADGVEYEFGDGFVEHFVLL